MFYVYEDSYVYNNHIGLPESHQGNGYQCCWQYYDYYDCYGDRSRFFSGCQTNMTTESY